MSCREPPNIVPHPVDAIAAASTIAQAPFLKDV